MLILARFANVELAVGSGDLSQRLGVEALTIVVISARREV